MAHSARARRAATSFFAGSRPRESGTLSLITEDDRLMRDIMREISRSADDVSVRGRAERAKAREEVEQAKLLRKQARELLDAAHERLRELSGSRASLETVLSHQSRQRADKLRRSVGDARDRSVAAREHSDAAQARTDTARSRMAAGEERRAADAQAGGEGSKDAPEER